MIERVEMAAYGISGLLSTYEELANMGRRTYTEIFLDMLDSLSDGEQRLVGNVTMKKELGWDDDRYDRVKAQLEEEGVIIVGRGKGGSVALATAPGTEELKLFVSYSHCDDELKNEFVKHIEPLCRANLIAAWHDGRLVPGEDWEQNILDQLEEADIIVVLISIDFINSSFCYDIELERALERHDADEAVVIPVILRECLWQQTPFAQLLALPKDGKAVTSWPNSDEAFTSVAAGIRRVAEELFD